MSDDSSPEVHFIRNHCIVIYAHFLLQELKIAHSLKDVIFWHEGEAIGSDMEAHFVTA